MSYPTLSIIIPVYNSEKTLERCLNSVLNQSYADYEIICVDDGSKDGGVDLINKFIAKDDRVKLIKIENSGPFIARYCGVNIAQGKFCLFLDADDWITEDALENLVLPAVNKNLDIVVGRLLLVQEGTIKPSYLQNELQKVVRENTFNLKDICYELLKHHVGIVAKLIRRDLIIRAYNKIKTNARSCEDMMILYFAYFAAKRIQMIYDFVYVYEQDTPNSLTKKNQVAIETLDSYSKIIDILSAEFNIDSKAKKVIVDKCLSVIKWNISRSIEIKTPDINEVKKFMVKYGVEDFKKIDFLRSHSLKSSRNKIKKIFKNIKNLLNNNKKTEIKDECVSFEQVIERIKRKSKDEKVSVCFYVNHALKWQSEKVFQFFKTDNRFIVEFVFYEDVNEKTDVTIFKDKGVPFRKAEEVSPDRYDIIFYQQPWNIQKNWVLRKTHQHALTCYIPYCVYSLESKLNNMMEFHPFLWRQFCDSIYDVENKSEKFKIFLGSTKIETILEKLIKAKVEKKKFNILYAPHHSFENNSLRMATFHDFGNQILDFAEDHQDDINWTFRPHPRFCHSAISSKKVSDIQLTYYFSKWKKIGSIDESADYLSILAETDLLITDSVSFLFDYSATQKPVIHLRSLYQRDPFTQGMHKIMKGYYEVYDSTSLNNCLKELIDKRKDRLRTKRISQQDDLHRFASKNIYEYIVNHIFN